jgi:hypothetical protein
MPALASGNGWSCPRPISLSLWNLRQVWLISTTGVCSILNTTLEHIERTFVFPNVVKFLLWCILLALCWPLALLALLLYPLVWILLLPFRLVGIAVDGVLGVLRGIVLLPVRLLTGARTV